MNLREAKDFTRWLAGIAICIWISVLVVNVGLYMSPFARDDTDPADGRSGMRLYTDALTGCQYLGAIDGWITPRIDKDGKQVCVVAEVKP